MNLIHRFDTRPLFRSLLALLALSPWVVQAAEKPNVLFIIVDDMNWRLGCYGNEKAVTPNLDRLAERSLRFDRAYCNFPVCGASRISVLSGRYPSTTGVLNNGVDPRIVLGKDYRFLPEYFREHGYQTAGVGKIPHTPEQIGSIEWDYHRDPQWEPVDMFASVENIKEMRAWPAAKHPDGVTALEAVDLLEEERAEPLFLAVGFHRPHAPRAAPQAYFDQVDPEAIEIPEVGGPGSGLPEIAIPPNFQPDYPESKIRSQLHAYHSTAAFIDDQVGLLLDTLDRRGLWEETIVVFFSDHGVHLGDHGGFWGKMSLMEESMKVPLLVHVPGLVEGQATSQPVGLVDLFPTLTEACGLPPQEGVEGESLLPLLRDPGSEREKSEVFGMVRRSKKNEALGYSVRTQRYAYSEWPDGSKQLYDHLKDPGELKNRAGEAELEAVETRLANKLAKHRARTPLRGPEESGRPTPGQAKTVSAAPATPAPARSKEEKKEKPNIIIIMADDLGYEDVGVHGAPDVKTPHLDSLAANGIRFTQAYISAPVCSPSRAGFLTGRYQNRFGFEFLAAEETAGPPDRKVGLAVEEVTIADRMKELGYRTGCIGKWHVGSEEVFLPMQRGFDEFYGTLGQSGYYAPMLLDSRVGPKPRKVKEEGYYVTDDYTDRAVEFIQDHRDEPYFLFLSHFAVHKPHDATDKYLNRFSDIEDPVRHAYVAMLSALDDGVGRVMDALEETGVEEDTLVVFFSDNGGTTGSSNRPLRGRKGGTWEGGIRTPFFMQWKSRWPKARVYERPIISLDLLPTCVALGGGAVEPSWELDGVNLLPYLDGKKAGAPHENLFWRFGTQWALRSGDWKLLQAREGKGGSIQIAKEGPVRLFNLKEDGNEQNDLAADHPEKVEALRDLWQAWADTLPEPSWFPVPVE